MGIMRVRMGLEMNENGSSELYQFVWTMYQYLVLCFSFDEFLSIAVM